MTIFETQMIKILKKLKDNYGVVEIKAEFETEATRMNELMRLKEIISQAGLGLVIKIGGAEAITNILDAKQIGVSGLIAPMVESAYAMKKFLMAINKYFSENEKKEIHFGVNVETHLAYKNFSEMLKLDLIRLIDTITVGRTDMCGSLGLGKDDINCDEVYKIVEEIFTIAKKKGFRTTMGGGMSAKSAGFIRKLSKKKLLDRFETRKVVFRVQKDLSKIARGIDMANEFELLWLESKREYYGNIYREDESRIEALKKRLAVKRKLG